MAQPRPSFRFSLMKDFVAFLLHNKLHEVCLENLRLAKEVNIPLLNLFAHLSETELLEMSRSGLSLFFNQILTDTALEKAFEELHKWKANELPGIPKEKIEISDIVASYSIRKQFFLKFLPEYTSDTRLLVQIMIELENFYLQLEKHAFEVFIEIQQEELIKKNEFLASLINNSVDGIIAFDPDMCVLEWSPMLEKNTGVKKEAILGKYIYEVFPGYEHTEEAKATLQAFQGKEVYLADKPYQTKHGWYDAHVVPLYGKNKKVIGALSIVRDTTERKTAELILKRQQSQLQATNEALQEQKEELHENLAQLEELQQVLEEKQDLLLEAQAVAHLGIWEYDVNRDAVYWSDEMKRIFGYTLEEIHLNYHSYLARIHEEDKEWVHAVIANCLHTYEAYNFEHRIIHLDGEVRWLLAQGKPVLTGQGKLWKLRGTALDITERKQAELQALQDQHFIHTLADTSPDVITVYDLEKRVNIYSSKEIYSMLGYSPEQLQELKDKGVQGLVEVIHPQDLASILEFLESYKTYTGTKARDVEYRIKDHNGEYRWILDRYNIFKCSKDGLPTQIIGLARDNTARKTAEEELRTLNYKLHETNEELVRSEEALKDLNNELEFRIGLRTNELMQKNEQLSRINTDLDNFIYTASHDLKAPIANIDGLLNALSKRVKDKLTQQELYMLGMIKDSIERFNRTLADLTNIAETQKDIEDEEVEKVSFSALLEELRSDINPWIKEKDAQVITHLGIDEINFAKKNLRSILYNLLTNALKYSSKDRKPQVKIETKCEGEYTLLSIEDNGLGIPESQQLKIFSLFKRVHTHVEGSGIGLYIVKRIIENNGGKIELKSKIDQGTTFNIYLKHRSSTIPEQGLQEDLEQI